MCLDLYHYLFIKYPNCRKFAILKYLPNRDYTQFWKSRLKEDFFLSQLFRKFERPPQWEQWQVQAGSFSLATDEEIITFLLSTGIGAHLLKQTKDGFQLDLLHLKKLQTRTKLLPLGALLLADRNRENYRIRRNLNEWDIETLDSTCWPESLASLGRSLLVKIISDSIRFPVASKVLPFVHLLPDWLQRLLAPCKLIAVNEENVRRLLGLKRCSWKAFTTEAIPSEPAFLSKTESPISRDFAKLSLLVENYTDNLPKINKASAFFYAIGIKSHRQNHDSLCKHLISALLFEQIFWNYHVFKNLVIFLLSNALKIAPVVNFATEETKLTKTKIHLFVLEVCVPVIKNAEDLFRHVFANSAIPRLETLFLRQEFSYH